MAGGGSPEFRRSGDRDRPGTGEGRWGAHLGSVWGRRWGRGCAGARARRLQAARGATGLPPARPSLGRGNTRRCEPLGDPGRGSGRLAGDGRAWSGGLNCGGAHGVVADSTGAWRWRARARMALAFYRRLTAIAWSSNAPRGRARPRAARTGPDMHAYRGATCGDTDSHGSRRACLSREGVLPREARPQAAQPAWGHGPAGPGCRGRARRARGRARRSGRRNVAAWRQLFKLALFESKILQKFE
jgi:hypothetical protein